MGLGDDGASAFARGGSLASLCGLLIIWPLIIVVAILVKVKMSGGPAFFCQKRVGKDGKLFTCHKLSRFASFLPSRFGNAQASLALLSPWRQFRTMTMNHNGSSVSVAGDSRITPLGAKLYFD